MKYCLNLFFSGCIIISCTFLSAQTYVYSGPVSLALANIKTIDDSPWASLSNPSSIAFFEHSSVAIFYQDQYHLSELSTRSATGIIPSKWGVFSGLFLQNGFSENLLNRFNIGYSRLFGESFSAGLQLNYITHQIAGARGETAFYSVLGVHYLPSERVRLGVFIQNIEQAGIEHGTSYYYLPSFFNVGVHWEASKEISLFGELEKESSQHIMAKVALQLEFLNCLAIRTGVIGNPFQYTFGGGVQLKGLQFDFGFAHHQQLGLSSSVGLSYVLKSLK